MKLTKSILATSLLGVFLALPATPILAEGVTAKAILGGTPFAHTNYGKNVIRGRAELYSDDQGASTKVKVKMSGLKPGTAHIGHIHGGTCAQLFTGTILHNLEPLIADSEGKGTSKTDIPKSMQGFTDCEWWVAFHEGAENAAPQTPALAVGPVITKGQDHEHGHSHEHKHGRE